MYMYIHALFQESVGEKSIKTYIVTFYIKMLDTCQKKGLNFADLKANVKFE